MRERAMKLFPIRQDLKGVGWTMLGNQLIHTVASTVLLSLAIGFQMRNEIAAIIGASGVIDLEQLQTLIVQAAASASFNDLLVVLNAIVAALGIIPAIIYARHRQISLRPALGFKGISAVDIGLFFAALMGINAIGSLGVIGTELLFNSAGLSVYVDLLFGDSDFSYWGMAVYAVLIAPLIEEYFFRGVLLDGIRPYGERYAVMVCAVLFGLMHGNLMQFLPAALIGWYLGYLRIKTGSWGLCLLLHALNNACSLIIDALMEALVTDSSAMAVQILYIGALTVVFVLCWRRILARFGELAEAEFTVGYSALISAPALLWIYMVFRMLISNVSHLT